MTGYKFLISFIIALGLIFLASAITITEDPTNPPDGTTTSNSSIVFNYNITTDYMNSTTWSWDGTNYSIYDSSLVLHLGLNNFSALGENDTHVFDDSIYQNNGTVVGGSNISWTPNGKYGGAFNFSGVVTGSYVNITNAYTYPSITISFWVKANGLQVGKGIISTMNITDYNNNVGWAMFFSSGSNEGKIRFMIGNSTLSNYSTTALRYDDGNWYHVVGRWNGSDIRVFINGVDKTNFPTQFGQISTMVKTNNSLRIGDYATQAGTNRYFSGLIDNVKIFNRSLSDLEISQDYSSSLIKDDSQNWTFWTNQSLSNRGNSTNSNPYNYYLCSSNSTTDKCSTQKTITQTIPLVTLTANFTNSIGTISDYFYGVNDETLVLSGSSYSDLDSDCDNIKDTPINLLLNRNIFANAGMNSVRVFLWINHISISENNYNQTWIQWLIDEAEYANSRGYRITLSPMYAIPDWLQNRTSGYCNSTNYNSCPPTNNTKFAIIENYIINNLTQVIPEEDIDFEVLNEPWGTGWLNNATNTDKVLFYVDMFNTTRNYIKDSHPLVSVGWTGSYDLSSYFYRTVGLISNLTNNTDFINLHAYPYDFITTNQLVVNLQNLTATCSLHGFNCPRMGFSEWNVWDGTYTYSFNRYSAETAFAYQSVLNYNPTNVSLIFFQFSKFESYNTCSALYPEYPLKFPMFNELDNYFQPTYNVTKNFAHLCPAGATVYQSSSDDSDIKIVTCKNSTNYNTIIINTDTSSKNVSLDLSGSEVTKLLDYENGDFYGVDSNNISQLGILDSYDILYLQGEHSGVAGNVLHLKLNDGSGTTAYDISDETNDGTVSGATWDNDGINLSLILNTDYSLVSTLFTLINPDLDWDLLNLVYGYEIYDTRTSEGLGSFADFIPIIIIAIVIGLVVLLLSKAFGGGGRER